MKDDDRLEEAGVSRRKLLTGSGKAAILAGLASAAGGGAVGVAGFTRPAHAKLPRRRVVARCPPAAATMPAAAANVFLRTPH